MAEALARRGNHAAADAIFRQAVAGDGNLVELKDQGKDTDHQPWIGRFESICCPACESEAFEPAWVGNISAHHRCHGLLDPIRLWGRCLTCGLHRVVAPPPPETLERWSKSIRVRNRLVCHPPLMNSVMRWQRRTHCWNGFSLKASVKVGSIVNPWICQKKGLPDRIYWSSELGGVDSWLPHRGGTLWSMESSQSLNEQRGSSDIWGQKS